MVGCENHFAQEQEVWLHKAVFQLNCSALMAVWKHVDTCSNLMLTNHPEGGVPKPLWLKFLCEKPMQW